MPEKKTGRPRLDQADASMAFHVRLPAKQFERISRDAQAQRLPLSQHVRHLLKCATSDDPPR